MATKNREQNKISYRVINVNSREVLCSDCDSYAAADRAARDSESHETQPEVAIQKLVGDEWVQV